MSAPQDAQSRSGKIIAMTAYFGLIAAVAAGSIATSPLFAPDVGVPSGGDVSSTPTSESSSHRMFYLDDGVVYSWEDGHSERVIEASGVMEIRALTDGVAVTVSSSEGYELVHVSDGGKTEVIHRGLDSFDIESDGANRVGYTTRESTVVRDLRTGDEVTYPASDTWKIVPGRDAIVSVSEGMAWLREGDGAETPLGTTAEVVAVTDTQALVQSGERYRWVTFSGGESDVSAILSGHLDQVSPLGRGGSVQVFSTKSDGGALTLMEAVYVTEDGTWKLLDESPPGAIIQACGSPDATRIAVVTSEEVQASYLEQDRAAVRPPLLTTVIFDITSGDRVDEFPGGTISWCPGDDLWWQHPTAHVH